MIKGKDLILSIDRVPIAASKTCEISLERDVIEVCSPNSSIWRAYKTTTCGWNATTNGLCSTMSAAEKINAALINGSELLLRFYDKTRGLNRAGMCVLTKCSITGSVGSLVQWSASMQGTGLLGFPVDYTPDTFEGRKMTISGGAVHFTSAAKTDLYHTDVTLEKGDTLYIKADSGCQWAMLAGEFDRDFEQDVMNCYDITPIFLSGTDSMVYQAKASGRYCLLADDSVCIVSATKIVKENPTAAIDDM